MVTMSVKARPPPHLFSMLCSEPDPPSDVRFSDVGPDSAVVLWAPPRAVVSGFRLFLTVAGMSPVEKRIPGRVSRFPLRNLRPDTEYTATLHSDMDGELSTGVRSSFTTGVCVSVCGGGPSPQLGPSIHPSLRPSSSSCWKRSCLQF